MGAPNRKWAEGFELGPFRLISPLGVGGMGEVWRAVHRASELEVAVKLVLAEHASRPRYRRALVDEVRAAAGLDHPAVVTLFDFGTVDHATETRSRGRLPSGTPYLAMELADGGTLAERKQAWRWNRLQRLLERLLEGLGHAHGRGVLHLDLKPANVLVTTEPDGSEGIRIADFGLAMVLGRAGEGGEAKGTRGSPGYMAPEQFRGNARDYGPATDLYALGCLAYQFACNRRPFRARSLRALEVAHTTQPPIPPSFLPASGCPVALAGWLRRLLAKSPEERFDSAAEARAALLELADPGPDEPGASAQSEREDALPPSLDSDLEAVTEVPSDWIEVPGADSGPASESAPGFGMSDAPLREAGRDELPAGVEGTSNLAGSPRAVCIPQEWPRRQDWQWLQGEVLRRVGAGLGLYEYRSVPLVGRAREQDWLWDVFRASNAGPALVCLSGPGGVGTSRLASWLAERAHEATGARALRAEFQSSSDRGLAALVGGILGELGGDEEGMESRLEEKMARLGMGDSTSRRTLASLVTGLFQPVFPRQDSMSSLAIQRAVVEMVECIARRRRVVLWLDGVQWSRNALGVAAGLLASKIISGLPIAVILTAREDLLAERPAESEALERLLQHASARAYPVAELTEGARYALIREMLHLESQLASRVARVAGGNPRFIRELVNEWVRRDLLRVGPRGLELKPGSGDPVPKNLLGMWTERLERLLERSPNPEASGIALERAACLGVDVQFDEWSHACRDGVESEDLEALASHLVVERLAENTNFGWRWSQSAVMASILARARGAGRFLAHHSACAQMLRDRYGPPKDEMAVRVGRHHAQAEEWSAAVEPLSDGAEFESRRALTRLSDVLELLELALERSEWPADDSRWGRLWIRWAHRMQDELVGDRAVEYCRRAERGAQAHGWKWVAAQARQIRIAMLYQEGREAEMVGALRAYVDWARSEGSEGSAHWAMAQLAKALCRALAEHEEARELAEAAVEYFRPRPGREISLGDSLLVLGYVLTHEESWVAEAMDPLAEAAEIYRRLDIPACLVLCLVSQMEAEIAAGDLDAAEAYLLEVVELDERLHYVGYCRGIANATMADLKNRRAQYADSRRLLEPAWRAARVQDTLDVAGHGALLLVAAAGLGDWELWEGCVDGIFRSFDVGLALRDDLIWACRLAAAQGEVERARTLLERCRRMAVGSGAPRVEEIFARALGSLPAP